ncbi:AAC(3) family N-acetyltransferase [Streptacidiphilus sp. N1-10]|uniref:Aminoglycoside N(3)-acetyltransferase n=1 Tax=Streptacidiphilus jeojiensis TaxID=3229225 RepID=A0ABV6XY09_9ACTN
MASADTPMAAAETARDRAALVADLRRLGLGRGATVLVQSSMRAVGPVRGGAETVAGALLEAIGPRGNLLVYTATVENSLTSPFYREGTAGLDEAGRRRYQDAMPGFERRSTPCSPSMGVLSEVVRRLPRARRSSHPKTSFAAVGPQAAALTARHPLHQHLGPDTPLGRLYRGGGLGLLLGVGFDRFTPFHLAEYLLPDRPTRAYACKIGPPGQARWVRFRDLWLPDRNFAELGRRVSASVPVAEGRVGEASALLVPVRPAVDAALRHWADTVG